MTLPYLTTEQMIEVDRAMIEDYGIELIQMMENAGRGLAMLARDRFFDGDPVGRRVVVLAGAGGNGGGAMVAARRLHTWGATVFLVLGKPAEGVRGVPAHQLRILANMGIEPGEPPDAAELVLDGLVGYSLRGPPRGRVAELIEWANRQSAPVLSLDVPSGLESTSGERFEPCIEADVTMTLALPKEGLREADVGELYLADISVPPALYTGLQLEVGPLFAERDVIRVR